MKINHLLAGLANCVGISVGVFLGVPQIAQAASLGTCGPGNNWVETCSGGNNVDSFSNSHAYLLLKDSSGTQFTFKGTGPAKVTRDNPVDAIVGDPILGNVGAVDGRNGVIRTSLIESFEILFGGQQFTLNGVGVGAIVQSTELGIDRPDLADSFFKVFATIDGPVGSARNVNPIMVSANAWLKGVPPNQVLPVAPGEGNPPAPPLFYANGSSCTDTNPIAAILYCGFSEVEFYATNSTGEFILDTNGNRINTFTLIQERHIVEVPEPSTIFGSALFLGAGAWMKIKKMGKNKKKSPTLVS